MAEWAGRDWAVSWDDARDVLTPAPLTEPGAGKGRIKAAYGGWIALESVRSVEGWINGSTAGVRVHLDGDRVVDVLEEDSGNCDPTATWNEYLYDGCWALGAGRKLAAWIGVAYRDAWTK